MLTIIYCCLVLHNLCEQHKVTVDEEAVRRQITHDQLMSPTVTLQRQYVVSSTEGKTILNIFTSTYYEFILYTRSDKMLHLTSIIIITNIYFTANIFLASLIRYIVQNRNCHKHWVLALYFNIIGRRAPMPPYFHTSTD